MSIYSDKVVNDLKEFGAPVPMEFFDKVVAGKKFVPIRPCRNLSKHSLEEACIQLIMYKDADGKLYRTPHTIDLWVHPSQRQQAVDELSAPVICIRTLREEIGMWESPLDWYISCDHMPVYMGVRWSGR